jgi:hypothetical protein
MRYTKGPQNIPNGRKIDKMVIKYTNIFHCKTLQILPNLGFFVWKYAIWQPWRWSASFVDYLNVFRHFFSFDAELGFFFVNAFVDEHLCITYECCISVCNVTDEWKTNSAESKQPTISMINIYEDNYSQYVSMINLYTTYSKILISKIAINNMYLW